MNIPLDYYKIFYEIAKVSSFSKASQNLYVSQSSVSQTLAKLEDIMGVTLIERTTKKIKLTSIGEVLYKGLDNIFLVLDQTESTIMRMINMEEGIIRIGISDTLCKYVFMPYLSAYKSRYPGIHLSLVNQPSSESIHALSRGELDIAIVNTLPKTVEKEIVIQPLIKFCDVFIVNNDSAYTIKTPFEELAQGAFVSLDRGATTRCYTEWLFSSKGYTFNPDIELSNIDLVFDFVKAGFGIGVVPNYATKNRTDINVLPFPKGSQPRQIALAYDANVTMSIPKKRFISHTKTMSKEE